MRKLSRLGSVLALTALALLSTSHAEAQAEPEPSQALDTDPAPSPRGYGLGVDGAAIALGDYAARLDVLLAPALSLGVSLGASQREGRDALLVEALATLWCLGQGLEGPFVSALVGASGAGPWAGEVSGYVVRAGGEAGYQIVWEALTISLGAGAHATLAEGAEPSPALRLRAALGLVF